MSDLLKCECCGRDFFEGVPKKVMQELLKEDGLTGSELARRIGCSAASVSKAIRLLEPENYISIVPMKFSKNVKMISLEPMFKKAINLKAISR